MRYMKLLTVLGICSLSLGATPYAHAQRVGVGSGVAPGYAGQANRNSAYGNPSYGDPAYGNQNNANPGYDPGYGDQANSYPADDEPGYGTPAEGYQTFGYPANGNQAYADPGYAYQPYGNSVYVDAPPVCSYGYYGYYPYECAPYGYYGPSYFSGGIFIGAGPWFHGFGFRGSSSFIGRPRVARRFVARGPIGGGFARGDVVGRAPAGSVFRGGTSSSTPRGDSFRGRGTRGGSGSRGHGRR